MSDPGAIGYLQIDQLQQSLVQNKYLVVDIRDQQAYQQGHIPGAKLLTNENIQQFLLDADLDAPLVVCCYHGISSIQAAQYLANQDFTDVYSLEGGFTQWQSAFPNDIEHGL
jgi:thiosulfate sulfurtransferase